MDDEMTRASSPHYENARCQDERQTKNCLHSRLETFPLGCQVNTNWVTNWLFYSKRIMIMRGGWIVS